MATKWRSFEITSTSKLGAWRGLVKDKEARDLSPVEFIELDQFHVQDGKIVKLPGWREWDVTYTPETAHKLIFGYDFQLTTGSYVFLIGNKRYMYRWPHAGNLSAALNGTAFTGNDTDRWQSVEMGNSLFLTNGVDPIQTFDGTTIAALSGDADMPVKTFCLGELTNHLLLGKTTEGSTTHLRRLRWSDIDLPGVFIPSDSNEADYYDFPSELGEIMSIKNLGQISSVIYGSRAIYSIHYIGLPFIFAVERRIVGEGLLAPYSVVSVNDRHFFLGHRDFYEYTGGSNLRPLGFDRIISYFFGQFDRSTSQNIYSYFHPVFKEAWWIYVSRDSAGAGFDKCLVYNFQSDTWSTRNNFPFSFVTSMLNQSERTIAQATNRISAASGTWRDKQGKGIWQVVTGD